MMRARGLRLSLRALGGRLGAQWERERRDTLFLMAPVLVSVLAHLPWLPWWVGTGFLVLFAWRLGLLFSGRWLPRASVRWAGAVAATAAVWAHYDTLVGREPGVALLVLFLGLKLMEMRASRDLFVVIFLSLFLLLAAFLHSQSIGTAAIVLVALAGLLAAMLTMQYKRQEASIGQRLRTIGVLMMQALPVAAVLFVLFPRPGGPLWGVPGDTSRASTGLSESMTPGAISDLGESPRSHSGCNSKARCHRSRRCTGEDRPSAASTARPGGRCRDPSCHCRRLTSASIPDGGPPTRSRRSRRAARGCSPSNCRFE
jgi:hypothetical protein